MTINEELMELEYANSCATEHYEELDIDKQRDYLKTILAQEILRVAFTKKDGDSREMYCTLQNEFVPEHKKYFSETNSRKKNTEVLAVFDMEKADWRSFRMDSITAFEIITEEALDFNFEKSVCDEFEDVPF